MTHAHDLMQHTSQENLYKYSQVNTKVQVNSNTNDTKSANCELATVLTYIDLSYCHLTVLTIYLLKSSILSSCEDSDDDPGLSQGHPKLRKTLVWYCSHTQTERWLTRGSINPWSLNGACQNDMMTTSDGIMMVHCWVLN